MEVALRRTRFDLFATATLVVYAAALTGLVAAAVALLDGVALLLVLAGLTVFWLFHAGLFVYTWTRMRKVDHPLGLHGDGLHARSQLGEIVAPWEAVASVALERAWNGRRLRIRLVPPGDPGRAAVVAHVPPRCCGPSTAAGCATRCGSSTWTSTGCARPSSWSPAGACRSPIPDARPARPRSRARAAGVRR